MNVAYIPTASKKSYVYYCYHTLNTHHTLLEKADFRNYEKADDATPTKYDIQKLQKIKPFQN